MIMSAFHHLKSALDMVLETDTFELRQVMHLLAVMDVKIIMAGPFGSWRWMVGLRRSKIAKESVQGMMSR
jgi:hypothetical protein